MKPVVAPLIALATRFHERRFIRYILASVGALAVDIGSFLLMLSTGSPPPLAAAAGYTLGILAHWLLSSRTVFNDTVAPRGMARTKQKALFVASALAGLGLTTAIVAGGDAIGIDPRVAKLFAIVVAFLLTWILRSRVVFR